VPPPWCALPLGRSAQGLCELAGNGDWEWVLDTLRTDPFGPEFGLDPIFDLQPGGLAIRRGGGHYLSPLVNSARARNSTYRDLATIGFRCVMPAVALEP
jgi:formylglycine-generating enzyme required for sulfatase activity